MEEQTKPRARSQFAKPAGSNSESKGTSPNTYLAIGQVLKGKERDDGRPSGRYIKIQVQRRRNKETGQLEGSGEVTLRDGDILMIQKPNYEVPHFVEANIVLKRPKA